MALDDLQWTDDASLHLLRLLASEVASLPVMVLVTCHDPERAHRWKRRSAIGVFAVIMEALNVRTVRAYN